MYKYVDKRLSYHLLLLLIEEENEFLGVRSAQAASDINDGDLVRLKSGGPRMTVDKGGAPTREGYVFCDWFDGDGSRRHGSYFKTKSLEKQTPEQLSPQAQAKSSTKKLSNSDREFFVNIMIKRELKEQDALSFIDTAEGHIAEWLETLRATSTGKTLWEEVMRAACSDGGKICEGDVVYLKSGSNPMTAVNIDNEKRTVSCIWHHALGFSSSDFLLGCLTKDDPAE